MNMVRQRASLQKSVAEAVVKTLSKAQGSVTLEGSPLWQASRLLVPLSVNNRWQLPSGQIIAAGTILSTGSYDSQTPCSIWLSIPLNLSAVF